MSYARSAARSSRLTIQSSYNESHNGFHSPKPKAFYTKHKTIMSEEFYWTFTARKEKSVKLQPLANFNPLREAFDANEILSEVLAENGFGEGSRQGNDEVVPALCEVSKQFPDLVLFAHEEYSGFPGFSFYWIHNGKWFEATPKTSPLPFDKAALLPAKKLK